MSKYFCLFLILFLPVAKNAWSEDYGTTPVGWVVHKDEFGAMLPESEAAARLMYNKAATMGYVTLWLHLNTHSPPFSQIVDEAGFGRACIGALAILVNRSAVWHPNDGPRNYGPVCIVRASSAGVEELLRDNNFRQMLASNPPFLQ